MAVRASCFPLCRAPQENAPSLNHTQTALGSLSPHPPSFRSLHSTAPLLLMASQWASRGIWEAWKHSVHYWKLVFLTAEAALWRSKIRGRDVREDWLRPLRPPPPGSSP